MGFNKRYVFSINTIEALKKNSLKEYYGKSDALIFMDKLSSDVYELYKEGKSDEEILSIINQNMEEKTYEVY
jgi:hypothetical protein